MENIRFGLLCAVAVICFFLYQAWQNDYAPTQADATSASNQTTAQQDYASDEDDVPDASIEDDIAEQLSLLEGDVRNVLAAPSAERLRDGIRVVLAGPPNAGKSTLLNALVGRDAAIRFRIAEAEQPDLRRLAVEVAGEFARLVPVVDEGGDLPRHPAVG